MTRTAQITIRRSNEYINRLRDYIILVDGEKTGTIANGETKTFDIAPGAHTLRFTIDWGSSPVTSFEIDPEACKTFHVSGFRHAKWLAPAGIVLSFLLPFLARYIDFEYLAFLGLPIFLVLLFYLSFGRKNYLNVQADHANQGAA